MRIAVIGAGAWGTALAVLLHREKHTVALWARSRVLARTLAERRANTKYLPGVSLPDELTITSDAREALRGSHLVVAAVPTQFMRGVFKRMAKGFPAETTVVSVAKGIEVGTWMRPSEILNALLPGRSVVVLSGPSHAEEVARHMPTSLVAACTDEKEGHRVQSLFSVDRLRVYTHTDVAGVELGGALKNVIAIAAGIGEGLGLGDNARAALLTRGLAEIARLGAALGAEPMTFSGLSGLGDLLATCYSEHSRNRAVGFAVGQGSTIEEIRGRMDAVAEGVDTTRSALVLAERTGVEMPITTQVHRVLFDGKDPRKAVNDLLLRAPRSEREPLSASPTNRRP